MADQIDAIREWVDNFREDIEAMKAIVEADKLDDDARKFAAAALNYLVTRMDLVPDWNETLGVIDDVMVLRVCIELAANYGIDEGINDTDALIRISRMTNESEIVESFLGPDLHAKFRKYCARLTDQEVRGRRPASIVESADVRAALYKEIENDLLRMPPAPFENPEEIAVKFKSYLQHKLD